MLTSICLKFSAMPVIWKYGVDGACPFSEFSPASKRGSKLVFVYNIIKLILVPFMTTKFADKSALENLLIVRLSKAD